jgi:HSP20 family protein
MAITPWNQTSMLNVMDRIFEESFGRNWPTNDNGQYVARLSLDAYTTDDAIIVTASVPGVDPENVDITVEGDTLTIRGEIPARLENVDYVYAERFHGSFSRTLKLNVPVDVDNIEATFEGGILTLVLPKTEEIRPKVIKVQTKS